MTRPTNPELCASFRALMTEGFHVPVGVDHEKALADTRGWRGELWRAFRDIEERMCPQPGDFNGDDDDGE